MTSRRRLLRVVPLAVVLGGCLGGDRTGETPAQPPDANQTTTAARPATDSSTPTPAATPTDRPSVADTPSATPTPTPTVTATPTATATVRIDDGAFEPRRLAVEPGTRVQWVNDDPDTHRVESMRVDAATATWEFSSPSVGRGERVEYVFWEPGAYAYFSPTWGRSTSCGLVAVGGVGFDGDLPCESGGGY